MDQTRRSLVSALGLLLPLGLTARGTGGPAAAAGLGYRPFEGAVREAFAGGAGGSRRVEVGHCDEVEAGLQGCYNDRPFAGFAAGRLRVVRAGGEPGRACKGVRLFVYAVELVLCEGGVPAGGRGIDFARLPPAPVLG